MSLIDNVQRIIVEDFSEEDQDAAGKLAGILNYFMTQSVDVINGRLSHENMNRELITLEVTVDANGTPTTTTRFTATQGIQGSTVLRAVNKTNSAVYADSQPFISFAPIGATLYKINNIKGLQANNKYQLLLEFVF